MTEETVICRETMERIERALNDDELALFRARIADFTQQEIADSWGVSQSTVSRKWSNTKDKIRSILSA